MWERKDKEGWLSSCVELGMLVPYLNALKDTNSKLNMKGQRKPKNKVT
jgi:hypothetical protein